MSRDFNKTPQWVLTTLFQRRAQLIAERKRDPAVLVDIPKTPQAEELEKSGATAEDNVSAKKTAPKTS